MRQDGRCVWHRFPISTYLDLPPMSTHPFIMCISHVLYRSALLFMKSLYGYIELWLHQWNPHTAVFEMEGVESLRWYNTMYDGRKRLYIAIRKLSAYIKPSAGTASSPNCAAIGLTDITHSVGIIAWQIDIRWRISVGSGFIVECN